MTWSFDDDFTSKKDQIRVLIGDVDEHDQLLSDEGIEFFLSIENGRLYEAAADVAEAIAARFARSVQKSVGAMSLSSQQKYEHFRDTAVALRDKSELFLDARPLVGGISKADKQTQEQDTDRVVPKFTKDQFDYPSTLPLHGGRSGPDGGEW